MVAIAVLPEISAHSQDPPGISDPKRFELPAFGETLSANPWVRVRLLEDAGGVQLACNSQIRVRHGAGSMQLPSGHWRVSALGTAPAQVQYRVFVKSFRVSEAPALETALRAWSGKGFVAAPVALGYQFESASGRLLDGREFWLSVGVFQSLAEAERTRKQLELEGVWAWIREQRLAPGMGSVEIRSNRGVVFGPWPLPIAFDADRPIQVHGPTEPKRSDYAGRLELEVGPNGQLELFETLPLEDYLAGVLPAEMPAAWPLDALKAQAVTARSDVLLHLGLKRGLEGFHFTDGEGDRVYAGHSGRRPATDAAVADTRGVVLTDGARIVPAVFSSNCGGWTENNDTVWSGPPDPNLRGIADFRDPAALSPVSNPSTWIRSRPNAYCSADPNGFRWSRRLSASEVTRYVNKDYPVGMVRRIDLGDRGPGGRLKWLRVVGDEGAVTIRKELPIRQAFGGLPSAMLIIDADTGPNGPIAFTFRGGGRGHGVGLCQHGARGMALDGADWREIVRHYFPASRVELLK